jgi:hypothetical protein
MKRGLIIIICVIIIIGILIGYNSYVNFHNKKAEEQRASIKSCTQNEDCIMQKFKSYDCIGWSSCFNKDEKPMNDIVFKFQPRFGLHCDPNFECAYNSCQCVEGKCVVQC